MTTPENVSPVTEQMVEEGAKEIWGSVKGNPYLPRWEVTDIQTNVSRDWVRYCAKWHLTQTVRLRSEVEKLQSNLLAVHNEKLNLQQDKDELLAANGVMREQLIKAAHLICRFQTHGRYPSDITGQFVDDTRMACHTAAQPTTARNLVEELRECKGALNIIRSDISCLRVEWFKEQGLETTVMVIENIKKWSNKALTGAKKDA